MPKLSKLYTKKQIDKIREGLITKHGNSCAICGKPRTAFKNSLSVDHEHKDGTIRGLLCYFDNKFTVGRYDIPKACKLMEYLVKYDNVSKNKDLLKRLNILIGKALK
jgi:Recombination endonuclease VII